MNAWGQVAHLRLLPHVFALSVSSEEPAKSLTRLGFGLTPGAPFCKTRDQQVSCLLTCKMGRSPASEMAGEAFKGRRHGKNLVRDLAPHQHQSHLFCPGVWASSPLADSSGWGGACRRVPGGGVHLPLVVAQPLPLIKALSASPASLIDWAFFLRDSLELESKSQIPGYNFC